MGMTLDGGSMIIGRSPQADWVLPDPDRIISKNHCRIDRGPQGFIIIDMSVNGVVVNGVPISRGIPRLLESGMVLQIGTMLIDVRIETAPAPQSAMAPSAGPLIPPSFVPGVLPAPETPRASAPQPPAPPPSPSPAFIPADFMDGPFGRASDAPPAEPAPEAGLAPKETPATGPAALQDWWSPAAKPAEPSVADIDTQLVPASAAIALAAENLGLADIVRARGGLDAPTLAGLVTLAADILPEEERRRLMKRLHELIREASG